MGVPVGLSCAVYTLKGAGLRWGRRRRGHRETVQMSSEEALRRMEARLRDSGGLVLSPSTTRTVDALGAGDVLEVRRGGSVSGWKAVEEDVAELPEEMVGPTERARRTAWQQRSAASTSSSSAAGEPVVTVHQGAPPPLRAPAVTKVYDWDWLQITVGLVTFGVYAGLLWFRWKRTGNFLFKVPKGKTLFTGAPKFVSPSESELLAEDDKARSKTALKRERMRREALWEQGATRSELEERDADEEAEVEVAYEPPVGEETPRLEEQLGRQMGEEREKKGGSRKVMGIDISHVTDVGTMDFVPPDGATFAQREEFRRQEREAYLFGKAGTRAAMDPDWWLELPFVCVIEMTHKGKRGLWGLDVDPARGHVDAVPVIRTFAFEDRDDAQRFCWMLRTRQHSVDQMPSVEAVPPENLWEAVDTAGNKVCVVPKGGPIMRPGRTIQDVEADLLSLAGFTEWGVDDIVRMYGGGAQVNLDELL